MIERVCFRGTRGETPRLRRRDVLVASIGAFLCLSLFAAPNLFSVSPYVQHPTADGMTIRFFTTAECAATVKCWPADDGNATSRRVMTESATCEEATALVAASTGDKPMWGTQYRHQVRFTGLEAGTKYGYEVKLGASGESGAYTNVFRTAPGKDSSVRFVAYSDSETCPPPPYAQDGERTEEETGATIQWEKDGPDTWKASKPAYYVSRSRGFAENIRHMQGEKPDLILVAGDIAARGGVQMFWDEYWRENAGGLGLGYNDPAGSTPILAALGNHDLYGNQNKNIYSLDAPSSSDKKFAIAKYNTYFEFEPNTADNSQLYHRQDYGPVTILFLDTVTDNPNNFRKGSAQYDWIVENLMDAQTNAMFTIVVSHQTPYSGGKHGNESDVKNVRNTLGPLMIQYGVDAWLCGHCEAQEHSQVPGTEVLPDGTERPHVVNVYDLGSGGDGLLCAKHEDNPYSVFNSLDDSSDGIHYGHLLIDVKPNADKGIWQLTMTPMYSYIGEKDGPSELRAYDDTVVVDGPSLPKPEWWIEEPVWTLATRITFAAGESTGTQYRGFLTKKGCEYAWGKGGEAKTDWKKSDGTPMELEKPDEVQSWELMVRE